MGLKHTPVPLAIIGGGAAGLFAASVAAERGLGTLLFERKARIGSKLLMTANGRCNLTKDISPDEMVRDIDYPVGPWVAKALKMCPPSLIQRGFRASGVRLKKMRDGRVFPENAQAASIVHVFGDLLRDKGVPILTNCPVTGIQPMKNGFLIEASSTFTVWAENVLIATGGYSFPKTGSVGDGQKFANKLGLEVTPCYPGLIGYEVSHPEIAKRSGMRFEHSFARVLSSDGAELFRADGEIYCEQWGIGGAAVYNCSRYAVRNVKERNWILEAEFDGVKLSIEAPQSRSMKEAIVTIGGVSRDEIDPSTMMSRKIPGLYFAGEVIDIDGPTGGYNLTMAFATARLAVMSILMSRTEKSSFPRY